LSNLEIHFALQQILKLYADIEKISWDNLFKIFRETTDKQGLTSYYYFLSECRAYSLLVKQGKNFLINWAEYEKFKKANGFDDE